MKFHTRYNVKEKEDNDNPDATINDYETFRKLVKGRAKPIKKTKYLLSITYKWLK